MMPISKISVGDQFQNKRLYPDSLIYVVVEVNTQEKMVLLQAITTEIKYIGKPFWKKNTDNLISENNLVYRMRENYAYDQS